MFFCSSRRRHTRWPRDWRSDVCSSDLVRESGASPPTCTPARGLRTVLQTGLTTRECPVKMCTNVTMLHVSTGQDVEIGRASCRERVEAWEVMASSTKTVMMTREHHTQ